MRVASIDLGFLSSAAIGVGVDEKSSSQAADPWLTVKSMSCDLSLWQLISGRIGEGVVTLHEPNVTLLFDAEDRLLTQIANPPEGDDALPRFRVENGTFTLKRIGRPDEVFHSINLEMRAVGPQLLLSGTIDDPEWGPWTVAGNQPTPAAAFALNLKTRKSFTFRQACCSERPSSARTFGKQ